jgi:hypothetical protein
MSEAKFTTYPKYKLNHGDDTEKGSIVDALGLDDDFANMVIKTLRIAEIEQMYERHKSGGENPLLKMLMGMRGE